MGTIWDRILPLATTALQIIAPVIVLLLALALLFRLSHRNSPIGLPKLVSDLPSFLAILIVATICVLPLAGVPIPQVLNNIALVVVGFYFGKRTIHETTE